MEKGGREPHDGPLAFPKKDVGSGMRASDGSKRQVSTQVPAGHRC